MRVTSLLSIILVLAIGQPNSINTSLKTAKAASYAPAFGKQPSIESIRMKGNKLIVTGENFGGDALIATDFIEHRTNHDSNFPDQRLVAPKAGKNIERDKIVSVQVRNSPLNGSVEPVFLILTDTLWARVIRPDRFSPTPSSLFVTAGDYLLLDLPGNGSSLGYIVTLDRNFLSRVTNSQFNTDTQQLYRVEQSGTTSMRIEIRYGEPAPTILVFNLFVN